MNMGRGSVCLGSSIFTGEPQSLFLTLQQFICRFSSDFHTTIHAGFSRLIGGKKSCRKGSCSNCAPRAQSQPQCQSVCSPALGRPPLTLWTYIACSSLGKNGTKTPLDGSMLCACIAQPTAYTPFYMTQHVDSIAWSPVPDHAKAINCSLRLICGAACAP